MPLPRSCRCFIALLVLGVGSAAHAASIAGRVTHTGGGGLAAEVLLWAEAPKGWIIHNTLTANANGDYVFNSLPNNTYKVFVRGAAADPNWANRWYDSAAPNSQGWIGEDADPLVIGNSGTNLTGINVVLPLNGGFDGQVRNNSSTPLAGMYVRAEWPSDYRYHHNDVTKGSPQAGNFSFRGMVAGTYAILVYDPNGTYRTTIFPGPFSVAANSNGTVGNLTIQTMPTDPREPNNTRTAGNSLIDSTGLHAIPSQPFLATGSAISPRNGDIDWYCLDAVEGDHFLLSTTTNITVAGVTRDHPWTDPIIGWFTSGGSLLAWADDDAGSFNPRLEVWVTSAGRYCAAVSMYGDTAWNGTGQGSSGQYVLRIEMLNRRPQLAVSFDGAPAPQPPDTLVQAEDVTLTLDLAYSDPDQDALTVTATAIDALGDPMTDGVLTPGATSGTWVWDIPPTGGVNSPYQVTFKVSDGSLDVTKVVLIEVTSTNVPPTTPVPVSPPIGAIITTPTTELLVDNATDVDLDPIEIQFQVLYDFPVGNPDQSTQIPQDVVQTGWTPADMPENTTVYWRVRAWDGQPVASYSPWSAWQSFRIDQANDDPPAPEIFKPAPGQLAISRRPTLSLINVEDPDLEQVSYVFQLASDEAFTNVVSESAPVAPTGAPVTAWRVEQELTWDTTYYARASAQDARGGDSGFGPSTPVSIKPNVLPAEPVFMDPEPSQCGSLVYTTMPEEIRIAKVMDPEDEPVHLEMSVVAAASAYDDGVTTFAEGDAAQVSALDSTRIPFDAANVPEDTALVFRARAFDGVANTMWTACAFWLDSSNSAPGASTILSPTDGGQGTLMGDSVKVDVQLGADPEASAGIPNTWVTLAYCVTEGPTPSCPDDPAQWARLDPSEVIDNIGSPLLQPVQTGQTWTVQVCTMDERLACGPMSQSTFDVAEGPGGNVTGGCDCNQGPGGGLWALVLLLSALWRTQRRMGATTR